MSSSTLNLSLLSDSAASLTISSDTVDGAIDNGKVKSGKEALHTSTSSTTSSFECVTPSSPLTRPGSSPTDRVVSPAVNVKTSPKKILSLSQNSGKRTDYLPWDDYFMSLAVLASYRSKDPATQVGAVLVNDEKKVMGTGYNGMPIGCDDDEFPWGKNNANPLDNKHAYVCHAEMNAIVNSIGNVRGCTMYTTLFPCNECAKLMIQTKVSRVVFMKDRNAWEMDASRRLFDHVGIDYRHFKSARGEVVIKFDPSCREN